MNINFFSCYKYIAFITILLFISTQQTFADERARKGKCYITLGYVESKNSYPSPAQKAQNSFIKFDDFELFERKDKKIYLTIGKTDKKLFDKLKSDGKTYNYNCSQGKGFIKRYSFDENFNLVDGKKKFIDFESSYFQVIAPIEAEKKRLVEAEVQKQVEARMEKMRLEEAVRQKKAEADRLASIEKAKQAEIDRLAAIEKAKQAEIDRLVAIEEAKLAAIEKVKQDEIDRLAKIEKAKQDEIRKKRDAEERIRREEEAKRKAEIAAAALAKEFPYYVVMSCGFNGSHMNILACFSGDYSDTNLELTNGSDYGLYQIQQLSSLGKETNEGLVINLRSTFSLTAQNASDNLILGAKVYSRASGQVVFQKQVAKYGSILVSN
tara:strand:+ start:563 stop:1702 length:1140 start_codon:yes stop_codon:yes gene_type:complete